MPTGESVRLRAPIPDMHQHGEPAEAGGAVATGLESCGCGGGESLGVGRLWREDGKVLYASSSEAEPQAVRVVWARPLSGRGGPVSLMRAGKKREVAYVPELTLFDSESRAVAEEELAGSMVLPVISVIYEVKPRFGNYYWDVETNLGRRKFLLSSPESNSFRPGEDAVVLRDVSGNCYEIASVSGLSRASRREMDRAI